jgi:very-short-patch-repair endonuclease
MLDVYRAVIEKWTELYVKELEEDRARMPNVELFQQLVYRAKWDKYCNAMMATLHVMDRYKSEKGELELFARMFGEQLGMEGTSLPIDVERRLDWYKARQAARFERVVRDTFGAYGVGSPIEQLFVMEWHYQQINEGFGVELKPQARLITDKGDVNVDFLVKDPKARGLPIVIELDGHEFHEKTKQQAAKDRKRERSIIRRGYHVVRFTGHEVFRGAEACVKEVVEMLTNPPGTK